MGRYQPQKVNPEYKQYFLINDFSGGINTADVDDKTLDNEFRRLINVDLSEAGLLKRRKGWGALDALNNLLEDDPLPDNIFLVTITKDIYQNFSDLEDGIPSVLDFTILIGYITILEEQNQLNFSTYHFIKNVSDSEITLTKYDFDLFAYQYTSDKTSYDKMQVINTVTYLDRVYFAMNEIDPAITGIGVFDIEHEAIYFLNKDFLGEIINSDANYDEYIPYRPNPIEIKNPAGGTGFNMLASDPLNWIDTSYTSIKSIRSAYLTQYQTANMLITNIPSSGQFRINLLVTGEVDMSLAEAIVFTFKKSKIIDAEETFVDITISKQVLATDETDDYIAFDIELLASDLLDTNEVYVNATMDFTANYKKSFADATDRGNQLNWSAAGAIDSYYILKIIDTTTEYHLYYKDRYGFSEEGLITVYATEEDASSEGYFDYTNFIYINDGSHNGIVYKYDVAVWVPKLGVYIQGDPIEYEVQAQGTGDYFFDITSSLYVPQSGQFTYNLVTPADGTYFTIEYTGSTIQYPEYTVYQDSTLDLIYDIDDSVKDVVEIKSFWDGEYVNKIKLTKIDEHLIMYAGNSMLWSDNQLFTYFPNTNFKVFPLDIDDEITSIQYFRGSHLIFTKKTIWRMSGDLGDQTSLVFTLINDAMGCIAPGTVRSYENTVIFLSKDGLYRVKQAYYQTGLENVEKIDQQLSNYIVKDKDAFSMIYGEEYWLMYNNNDEYDTLRHYYSINTRYGHPFSADKYAIKPSALSRLSNSLVAIKNGIFYVYNSGYYDFLNPVSLTENQEEATYTLKIMSTGISFNYPTHDKKFKQLYLNILSTTSSPLTVVNYYNGVTQQQYSAYTIVLNESGTLVYDDTADNPNVIGREASLAAVQEVPLFTQGDPIGSQFQTGFSVLGGATVPLVHKITMAGKAKFISLYIEQNEPNQFALKDIGYLFKIGKVKEAR